MTAKINALSTIRAKILGFLTFSAGIGGVGLLFKNAPNILLVAD